MNNFDTLYVDPRGRTARNAFIGALIVLIAIAAFYYRMVPGRSGQWSLVTLIFPYAILHARRLHDMGQTAWLVLAPVLLLIAAAWFRLYNAESGLTQPALYLALAVAAGFSIWGLAGKGQDGANRYGAPAPA